MTTTIKARDLKRSEGELLFNIQLREKKIKFIEEYAFSSHRKWRFDFVIGKPSDMIAVEIEGVKWSGKAHHQTPDGYARDCDKYNTATAMGWRVFRFTQAHVKNGRAIEFISNIINQALE